MKMKNYKILKLFFEFCFNIREIVYNYDAIYDFSVNSESIMSITLLIALIINLCIL